MNEHLAELMKLPTNDRARAARKLLDSLDDQEERIDFDEAWGQELARRVQGIVDGTMQTIDGAEARKRVLARLAALREA